MLHTHTHAYTTNHCFQTTLTCSSTVGGFALVRTNGEARGITYSAYGAGLLQADVTGAAVLSGQCDCYEANSCQNTG